jgi:hypothetical protein
MEHILSCKSFYVFSNQVNLQINKRTDRYVVETSLSTRIIRSALFWGAMHHWVLIPLLVEWRGLFLLHSSICHSEMAYPVCESMQDSETLLVSFPCSSQLEYAIWRQPRPKHAMHNYFTHPTQKWHSINTNLQNAVHVLCYLIMLHRKACRSKKGNFHFNWSTNVGGCLNS